MPSILERVYPEVRFGGFTHCDGTIQFFVRVRALLGLGGVVLDVGCGRGARKGDPCDLRRELQDFRSSGRKVVGIDVDPNAASNPFIDEFRSIVAGQPWPVEDASVDLVCSDYVMEHLHDPAGFFREAWRVLRPGGYLALRTPNALSYVALLSQLTPQRLHARVNSFVKRKDVSRDTFPTVYRCNTKRKLYRALRGQGFDAVVLSVEAEPGYMTFSSLAFRIAAAIHAVTPPFFRTTLLVYARKPEAMS